MKELQLKWGRYLAVVECDISTMVDWRWRNINRFVLPDINLMDFFCREA
jgi:hypothetical protein